MQVLDLFEKMGCVKLHILDQQYKNTELKVSCVKKELTLKNSAVNGRKAILINRIDPGMLDGDYYDRDAVYLGNDRIDDNKVYQLKVNYSAKFENTDVNWGGTLNEKHYTELQTKSNDLGTVQDVFVTGDAVSDKRIQSLHPAIRMQATNFIKEANAGSDGTLIRVAQGFRTYCQKIKKDFQF